MKEKNIIKRALSKLGTSTTSIAAGLKKRGIKGDQEDTISCPLANYLSKSLRADGVEVGKNEVTVSFKVPLSSSFQKFVSKFDEGYYPELVA